MPPHLKMNMRNQRVLLPHIHLQVGRHFDIDAAPLEDEYEEAIRAGSVETWIPDYSDSERRTLRPYITGTIVVVWGMSMIASAIRGFMTGDAFIVVPSAIITLPLMTILKFYFRSDHKEKGYEHDKSTKQTTRAI